MANLSAAPSPVRPCSCAASALAELIDRLVDQRLDQRLADLRPSSRRLYGGPTLAPGAKNNRQMRSAARRWQIELIKVGREIYVDADAWDAKLHGDKREAPITDADERTLAALGIELGGAR